MHRYKVTVIHNNQLVQVYPQRRESGASFEDVCKRIGMMVLAESVRDIRVYRDEQEYRVCQVERKDPITTTG